MKKTLKYWFYRLLRGRVFPAFSSQLKGIKLAVDPLMPAFHFWRDVDIESHFVYDHFITDGAVIFDIGANVGLHTYYFARRFANVRIYAFEPLPENAAYLRRMLTVNKINNVTVVEKALSTSSGVIYFDRDKNNHQGHISLEPSDLQVQATSLDDFIDQNKILPDFMKIDVENFEADVLDGFRSSVGKALPFIILELHSVEQGKRVADFLRPHHYRTFQLENKRNWGVKKPLLEVKNVSPDGNVPHGFWGTVLAIPPGKADQFKDLFDAAP